VSTAYQKKVWRCSQCLRDFEWGEESRRYSSVAMDEHCPDDAPNLCSEVCVARFQARMDSGEVEVPHVSAVGYTGARITGQRRGY
jgi:hypothetical protein